MQFILKIAEGFEITYPLLCCHPERTEGVKTLSEPFDHHAQGERISTLNIYLKPHRSR
jgi:hypothetical protein